MFLFSGSLFISCLFAPGLVAYKLNVNRLRLEMQPDSHGAEFLKYSLFVVLLSKG